MCTQTLKLSTFVRHLATSIPARPLLSSPRRHLQKGVSNSPAQSISTICSSAMNPESEESINYDCIDVSVRLNLSFKTLEKINALRDHFGVKTRTEVLQHLLEELLQD